MIYLLILSLVANGYFIYQRWGKKVIVERAPKHKLEQLKSKPNAIRRKK